MSKNLYFDELSSYNPPMLQHILEFHDRFNLVYQGPPRSLPEDLALFRRNFLQEEKDEYVKATEKGDLEGQLDALVDLVYVALGTAHLQGLGVAFSLAWERVHLANMKKLPVVDMTFKASERGGPFDVVKPKGWRRPYLADLVLTHPKVRFNTVSGSREMALDFLQRWCEAALAQGWPPPDVRKVVEAIDSTDVLEHGVRTILYHSEHVVVNPQRN